MSQLPEACPACGHPNAKPLVDLGELPRSGLLLRAPGERVPRHHLRYQYCPHCALIRQQVAHATPVDYSEVDRGTTRQAPDYVSHILEHLRGSLKDASRDLIIEVGANDGGFLDCLREAGWRRRLGIEPSRTLAAHAHRKGHEMVNVHLTPETAAGILARQGPASAVICRHTLEHVPSPSALVAAMKRLLKPGASLFIEVPSSTPLLERLQIYELWDEHLSVFSAGNLRCLLEGAGLDVTRCEELPHRDGANLLVWAKSDAHTKSAMAPKDELLTGRCSELAGAWARRSARLQRQAATWRTPVIAMGASHPQSNFLQYAGLGHLVTALLDDDPGKVGRFVPLPQPTPVISAEQALASHAHGGTLLLTAFGYPRWTEKIRSLFTARGFDCIEPIETATPNLLPA